MRACRADLLDNGIVLDVADQRGLRALCCGNLEYFQMMLGYDAATTELVALAIRIRRLPANHSNGRTNGRAKQPNEIRVQGYQKPPYKVPAGRRSTAKNLGGVTALR
jgi:hypothetical protein